MKEYKAPELEKVVYETEDCLINSKTIPHESGEGTGLLGG